MGWDKIYIGDFKETYRLDGELWDRPYAEFLHVYNTHSVLKVFSKKIKGEDDAEWECLEGKVYELNRYEVLKKFGIKSKLGFIIETVKEILNENSDNRKQRV